DDFLGIDGHGCLVVAWPAGTEGRSLARTARLAVMEWKREMRPCEQRDYSPHRQPQAMRAVKRSGLAVFAAGAHRRPAEQPRRAQPALGVDLAQAEAAAVLVQDRHLPPARLVRPA